MLVLHSNSLETYYNVNHAKHRKEVTLVKKVKANNMDTQEHRRYVKALNEDQEQYIDEINNKQIVFASAIAGCGKTTIAVGMAVKFLLEKRVEQIVFTRPVVETGASLGYLPGSASEKIDPYMMPLFQELKKYASHTEIAEWKNSKQLIVAPLQFMRGMNFHNTFLVADECSNATYSELRMLLTRIGKGSHFILTGDPTQSDLHERDQGGFKKCIDRLSGIPEIGIVEFKNQEVIRNPLISKILNRLDRVPLERQDPIKDYWRVDYDEDD